MRCRRALSFAAPVAVFLALRAPPAHAQVVAAEPVTPIAPPAPPGAPPLEVQVSLQLVVAADGSVESAVVASRVPQDAPSSYDEAALGAARAARFTPSTRDGRPLRARVEYVVVFHPSPDSAPVAPPLPTPAPEPSAPASVTPPAASGDPLREAEAQTVDVRGVGWSSPRGVGDVRVQRELLDAAPHQQASELLSAAPGFFVDHEDGEGLGNDVYLRGFDLDHGSGIEMRLGSIPINIPTHIQGQGYADANFIIPEVVRSIRVVEGPFDPRQGDAAIVGSAYFDLGVPERGYHFQTTYGSFDQVRVVGVVAPVDADEETFAAFSLRSTNGFGENRASQSGSVNAQYAFDVGARDHVKLTATAYGARALLPGVVRQDDVSAGRIGFYDSYPNNGEGQGVQSSRVILGADFDHVDANGGRFELAPWFMGTTFRARQNYTGELESSQLDLATPPQGDLFETTNLESAAGLTSRFHGAPLRVGDFAEIAAEPGVTLRVGHTNQTRSLLNPSDLQPWDRRIDASLDTFDGGAYLDVDVRLFKHLRLSGGPRADLLMVGINDHLANLVPAGTAPPNALPGAVRDVEGIAAGPRLTAAYELTQAVTPVVSYGEGFRSLDVQTLQEGSTPFSKIRSVEAGVRAQSKHERYTGSVAAFETWVGNELVFEAAAGGLETESASRRRGFVGSFVAKPVDWLLVSTALSVTDATFSTLVAGVGHYVPNIPPVLFRADLTARGPLTNFRGKPVIGRIGVGYTFLSGKHLTDTLTGPSNNVLNAKAAVRYGAFELGVDGYNVLNLRYADDAEVYVSNWSAKSGQQPASLATHLTAAPPLTVLGTLAIHL